MEIQIRQMELLDCVMYQRLNVFLSFNFIVLFRRDSESSEVRLYDSLRYIELHMLYTLEKVLSCMYTVYVEL